LSSSSEKDKLDFIHGGAAVPIGSTFVAGYRDLGASLDHVYEYRITS
jgi:hypothetical protein